MEIEYGVKSFTAMACFRQLVEFMHSACLSHLTRKIVSKMTYNVLSRTLNPIIRVLSNVCYHMFMHEVK